MSLPITEPEKLTPLEKELSQGWMNNPLDEPKLKSSEKRTSLIAKQLKICKQEFFELEISAEVEFYEYLQHMYGIKLHLDPLGNVLPDYNIIDERKFMMFKLKFSS